MAASEGIIGWDTTISVEATAGVGDFVDLAEVTNVTPPNETADEVDRTHMKSPGRYKESTQGLIEPGDATFQVNYVPGSATDDFIVAWKAAGENRATKITYPNGKYQLFPAYPKGWAPDGFDASGLLKATLTVKVAGAVTRG